MTGADKLFEAELADALAVMCDGLGAPPRESRARRSRGDLGDALQQVRNAQVPTIARALLERDPAGGSGVSRSSRTPTAANRAATRLLRMLSRAGHELPSYEQEPQGSADSELRELLMAITGYVRWDPTDRRWLERSGPPVPSPGLGPVLDGALYPASEREDSQLAGIANRIAQAVEQDSRRPTGPIDFDRFTLLTMREVARRIAAHLVPTATYLDIYDDAGGHPRWRLRAASGQTIASSGESFASQSNAREAATNFINLAYELDFEVYVNAGNRYSWRAKARNGQTIATAAASFNSERAAVRAADEVQMNAGTASD